MYYRLLKKHQQKGNSHCGETFEKIDYANNFLHFIPPSFI